MERLRRLAGAAESSLGEGEAGSTEGKQNGAAAASSGADPAASGDCEEAARLQFQFEMRRKVPLTSPALFQVKAMSPACCRHCLSAAWQFV